MAIYIRRVGEVGDGSVDASKLADGAIDLSTAKVVGQLPSTKLADGAVIESKIGNLEISTGKLKDQAVSLAKAQRALKIHHFIGDETEMSVVGTVETDIKIFKFPRPSTKEKGIQPEKLHINAEMKITGTSGAQGTLNVYIDEEVSPRITVNTVSNTYEMVEANADVSDLSNGKHTVRVALVADDASATAWNDLIEIFLEK